MKDGKKKPAGQESRKIFPEDQLKKKVHQKVTQWLSQMPYLDATSAKSKATTTFIVFYYPMEPYGNLFNFFFAFFFLLLYIAFHYPLN